MSKIFKDFTAWCRTIAAERHRRKVLRREREVKHEALHRVQVKEFGGEIFFCFDGIPLLHEDDLTDSIGSVTREARNHFCDYRMAMDA